MSTEFKSPPQLPTFEEAEERVANGTASAMDRWLAENEVADPLPAVEAWKATTQAMLDEVFQAGVQAGRGSVPDLSPESLATLKAEVARYAPPPPMYVGSHELKEVAPPKAVPREMELRCDACVQADRLEDEIVGTVAMGPVPGEPPLCCKCGQLARYAVHYQGASETGLPRVYTPTVTQRTGGSPNVIDLSPFRNATVHVLRVEATPEELAKGQAHVTELSDPPMWEKVPSKEAQLEGVVVEFVDPNGWRRARVKWDGCIDLHTYANTPLTIRGKGEEDSCDCYIHICDIDDFMLELEALRTAAQKHFDEHNPGCDGWGRYKDK